MSQTIEEHGKKTNSVFTVTGEPKRAFLSVSGEAATDRKVIDEVARVRKCAYDWNTVTWIARQLAAQH